MIDHDMWDVLRSSLQWIIVPILGAVAYFFKRYIARLDVLEQQVQELETRTAVIETKIDDIRDDIKEIKCGVTKLVDRK